MAIENHYIDTDKHVFITGSTGSGKTLLAQVYLSGYENVIKVDTKQEYFTDRQQGKEPWYGLVEGQDYEVCFSLQDVFYAENSKIIYVVPWDEQEPEFYNELCKFVFEKGNTILWIDELMTFTNSAQTNIKYLKALYTAGRSRRAVVWACTQRPSGIPAICIANSYHFFVFTLPQPQDRKKLVDVTSCNEFLIKPPKYVFWYYVEGEEHARQGILKFD